jgi:hypothetical protein
MLKFILLGLVAVLAILAVVISLRPEDFRVSRSATIAAPAPVVFEQVNDLHKWDAWSPWAKVDPNAKQTFGGPAAGVGSSFHWSGNNQVGEGTMTITESRPNELVRMNLEFVRPFKGTNTVDFTFQPQAGQTLVTWTMTGKNNFIGKTIGLFMDCEKMCGDQFEKGLADIERVAEAKAK